MDDIPIDIMRAARMVARELHLDPSISDSATFVIALAINRERERAAKVAHGWMHENGIGANAADVALEIWKGEQPS